MINGGKTDPQKSFKWDNASLLDIYIRDKRKDNTMLSIIYFDKTLIHNTNSISKCIIFLLFTKIYIKLNSFFFLTKVEFAHFT